MKKQDLALFMFWVFVPLMVILFPFFLTGCSPGAIKFEEEVVEEALVEDLKGR